ncbi:MAG: hypothetical protein WCS73_03310 [Lentisphaeria bacterium]
MNITKHTLITQKIKKNILDGVYGEKLPPLRVLMLEFDVSMQTISKAVKPLSISGFISPGPRGSVINYCAHKRVKHYAIGVLCKKIDSTAENREFLSNLASKLHYENYNTMFLDMGNKRLREDPSFWETCPIDILLFGYNTLTPECAMAVSRSGIIPLVRHYAGDLPVHVCEFDTFQTIDLVVSQLRERGYRKIALQFFTPLAGYQNFAAEQWAAICHKYDIDFSGCEKPLYFEEQPWPFDEMLPEVLLCWHLHSEAMLKKIAAAGLEEKIKVLSYLPNIRGYDNYIELNPPSAELYWEKLNDFLNLVAKAKPLEYLHCSVPYEVVFPKGIPLKK